MRRQKTPNSKGMKKRSNLTLTVLLRRTHPAETVDSRGGTKKVGRRQTIPAGENASPETDSAVRDRTSRGIEPIDMGNGHLKTNVEPPRKGEQGNDRNERCRRGQVQKHGRKAKEKGELDGDIRGTHLFSRSRVQDKGAGPQSGVMPWQRPNDYGKEPISEAD